MRGISRDHSKQWHTEAADFYFYFYFLLHQVALIAYTTKKNRVMNKQMRGVINSQPDGSRYWKGQLFGGAHSILLLVDHINN